MKQKINIVFWLALANFCNDYHDGMSSRLYKILCYAQHRLKRTEIGKLTLINNDMTFRKMSCKGQLIYRQLEKKYGE